MKSAQHTKSKLLQAGDCRQQLVTAKKNARKKPEKTALNIMVHFTIASGYTDFAIWEPPRHGSCCYNKDKVA